MSPDSQTPRQRPRLSITGGPPQPGGPQGPPPSAAAPNPVSWLPPSPIGPTAGPGPDGRSPSTWRRRSILVIAVVAAMVLIGLVVRLASTGGSGTNTQTPVASAPAANDAGSSSAGQPLDIDTAGRRYLEIVNPVNCAMKSLLAFEGEHGNGTTILDPSLFDDYMAQWSRVASARQGAYRQLVGETWPLTATADVSALARAWATQAQTEQALSESQNVELYNAAAQRMLDNSSGSTANPGMIRALLNLAPATETDRC